MLIAQDQFGGCKQTQQLKLQGHLGAMHGASYVCMSCMKSLPPPSPKINVVSLCGVRNRGIKMSEPSTNPPPRR